MGPVLIWPNVTSCKGILGSTCIGKSKAHSKQ